MIALCRLALAIAMAVVVFPVPSHAASIDLGGVRLRLPGIAVQPRSGYRTYREGSIYAHPRWYVTIQDSQKFATNDQGIWVGHDEAGNMVMQIELAAPTKLERGTTLPVQVDINRRYFANVPATVADERLVVVQGIDVERILGRLMSGTSVRMIADETIIETHLRGSSAAIRQVRDDAMIQRQLYAQGKVQVETEPEEPKDDAIQFYLPGVPGTGTAEVRFDIIEGTGLVLYAKFSRIPNYGDPAYAMPFTQTEAERAVALIRKAEEWTKIAVDNRVGLYSKRIGFVDDVNGNGHPPADDEATDAGESAEGADTTQQAGESTEAQGEAAPAESAGSAPVRADDPSDFKAVNFNSYEDGSTSVQLEHAVKGFSRRFNLTLDNALALAGSLEATIKHATFRLEKRDFDLKEKDKLFQ